MKKSGVSSYGADPFKLLETLFIVVLFNLFTFKMIKVNNKL